MKNRLILRIATILLLSASPFQAQAWWDIGHMAVATIAYQRLTPATKNWVDELIPVLGAHYKDTQSFVESSCWPDDIKRHKIYAFSPMHYTNIPYNPYNLPLPANAHQEVDILSGIRDAITALESPYAIPLEKAQFLGILVHLVGDLHQPLHSTSMYSPAHPGGNLGGNLFTLADSSHSNLHKLWDDGCGFFEPWKKRISRHPMSADAQTALNEIADAVTKTWPERKLVAPSNLDPAHWARESHDLAVAYGYKGVQSINDRGRKTWIKSGDTPTEMYIAAGQAIVAKQLATAGYRLARMLNDIHDRTINH
ncbi:MAG TPA: hypothetical protein ENJ82_14645 [Bacteroidetes bacterium]|nr:hypothetical protein [Bacteroidota bacterium]